jgi:pimeloyl-ACP methyl ester carboxylesterase
VSYTIARGIRFHIQELGPPDPAPGAPTVVFVHGLGLDNLASFYFTLAVPVMEAGARTILYDLRGHGLSEMPPAGYSIGDNVADLCALLDALDVPGPVHVVGNSYGGIVAARMAVEVPERVAGLALIEANCAGPDAATWFEDIANTITVAALRLEGLALNEQRWTRDRTHRRLARLAFNANRLLNQTSLIDDLAAELPLDTADLAAIGCPVLGVYGEDSDMAGAAADLPRHVRDCRVEVLPGEMHTVLRDATGVLRDLLLGWLPVPQTALREPA